MGSLGKQNKHQKGLYHSQLNLLSYRKPTEDTREAQAKDRIVTLCASGGRKKMSSILADQ
jgi:hypothetical protein